VALESAKLALHTPQRSRPERGLTVGAGAQSFQNDLNRSGASSVYPQCARYCCAPDLTNCHVVTSEVLEAEKTLGPAAGEIHLVTTSFTPWQVHCLRVDAARISISRTQTKDHGTLTLRSSCR
jgi:hypothetical protein